jgi:hypothetical protein
MKVLVATADTQGARPTDYNFCVEGELVWIQEPCGRDRRRDANSCGCGRGFAGVASHRATTTAKVMDLPMDFEGYVTALETSFRDGGWPVEFAMDIACMQQSFAARWEDGTVLERDLDTFTPRGDGETERGEGLL